MRLFSCHQSSNKNKGFAIIETLGMCTGRYTKKNRLSPKVLDLMVKDLAARTGLVAKNNRPEYGERYRALSKEKNTFPEAHMWVPWKLWKKYLV